MEQNPRRRGGSFHETTEQEDYQFDGPEPVDFSKLDLTHSYIENDDEDEDEIYNRGRSRSRSVHEFDANSAHLVVPALNENSSNENPIGIFKSSSGRQPEKITERTGPLHQKEVLALRKGLEEATQSINRYNPREDDEERMAADVEKRNRLSMPGSFSAGSGTFDPNTARRIKILMLGDSGVGKSSLITRWTQDTFSPSLVSTVGVNFKSKKVLIKGEYMQAQIWDTAGQEQFHKITTSYYKGAQGIMLVYDVSDTKTFENVSYWVKNIKSHASDTVQVALIGNKIDLRSSTESDKNIKFVETETGKEMSSKYSVPFFETSAKDSSFVNDAFMKLIEDIVESSNASKISVGHHHRHTVHGQGLDKKSLNEKSEKSGMLGSLLKDGGKRLSFNKNNYNNSYNSNNTTDKGSNSVEDKEKCRIS